MKAPTASSFSKRSFSTEIPQVDFQPNSSRLLVKKDAIEKPKTQSGILLPQSSSKNQQQLATVVAVGPGLRTNDGKYVPTFCRVGDRVILPDFGGMELKFNDQVYNVYRDDDIIGVVGNVDVKARVEQV
eukprot:UN00789